MTVITSILTANLEVITIKTEVITNPARFHCFPSRFDHRATDIVVLLLDVDFKLKSATEADFSLNLDGWENDPTRSVLS